MHAKNASYVQISLDCFASRLPLARVIGVTARFAASRAAPRPVVPRVLPDTQPCAGSHVPGVSKRRNKRTYPRAHLLMSQMWRTPFWDTYLAIGNRPYNGNPPSRTVQWKPSFPVQ